MEISLILSLSFAALLCLAAGTAFATPLSEKQQAVIKLEIEQKTLALIQAYGKADVEAVLKFYWDDPAFLLINEKAVVRENDAYRKGMRRYFQNISEEMIHTQKQEIRFLSDDTVLVAWQGPCEFRKKDGVLYANESFAATFVFKRIGGDWKIIYSHESSSPVKRVEPVDTTTAVLRMLDDYFAAVNARDPTKFLTFFSEAEDVTVFEDKDLRTSRKEFAAFVDGFFKDISQIQATWDQRVVHELTPTTAVVTGTFKVEAKDAKGSPMIFRNAFTFVLVKQGDRWLVRHVHESSLSPEPGKP